jgi:NitT/TauT family transport system permease protein
MPKAEDRQIIRRSWRDDVRKIFIMREPLPGWLGNSFFLMAIGLIVLAYSSVAYSGSNTLIPTWGKLAHGFAQMITDPRSGEHMLWNDTIASFTRLLPALGLASVLGVVLGLYMGTYVAAESMWGRILNFEENIVPNAAMVVFLTLFGFGFKMYMAVIVFGILPTIAGRVYAAVREVPDQHIFSAKTLGASGQEIIWTILFRQVLPQIIDAIRSTVGLALILLIATEWAAGQEGYGYRFLRLYRSARLDVILPYLMTLGFMGIGIQILFNRLQRILCPWYVKENGS